MAALNYWPSTAAWDANSTSNTWSNWSQYYAPIVREIAKPLLSVKAWARMQLARTERASVVFSEPLPALPSVLAVRAPRRVVVEHGIVGWIRRGTKRPL